MKYIDINQKFTAKVAEYIAKGYTINIATMSGSQGEVAHVDLTDGKQVVRVCGPAPTAGRVGSDKPNQ